MKKINLDVVLKGLDGQDLKMSPADVKPITVGKSLASMLQGTQSKVFEPMKAWELAQAFYNRDSVELDKSDLSKLEGIVSEDQQFIITVRGQIMEILHDAPESGNNTSSNEKLEKAQ